MILSELRDYLKQQHRLSLLEMANHFDIEADALRGMLRKWVSKGKVKQLDLGASCGTGCCKCDPAMTELYEWVDKV
ncbi:MAG TPA: sugar metabolism transcriptional regulator [Methyloprofundus sp.]|uniref:FeoC-like transcriptional regulator n=1 Tax=Methyloprofundus sp. TaxID=2020875 RepID=UPI0018058611|nr:FeoC-like transcriptional regulator [Methyloprofundus sp.]HIG65974.1 sugar metabolism transcriptional regulator [Methyloprofundus sp.]HIL78159.1 sugar metabolism transcriptional regulator [Methylococcales bacterium]